MKFKDDLSRRALLGLGILVLAEHINPLEALAAKEKSGKSKDTRNPSTQLYTRNKPNQPDSKSYKYKTNDPKNDSDKIVLARMIFGESRDCANLERVAVAYTAINRTKDNKRSNGTTLKEVILFPLQYSCFNLIDPNRIKVLNPEAYDAKTFATCLEIAQGVITGRHVDPTEGATHYYNPKYSNPKWARSNKMQKIGRIKTPDGFSQHVFYKEN